MADLSPEQLKKIRAQSDAWVIALNKGLIRMVFAVFLVLAAFYFTRPM
ncbi:hypothetical protein [Sphingomonas sp. MMS24-J13]